jgi:hypothetical protein
MLHVDPWSRWGPHVAQQLVILGPPFLRLVRLHKRKQAAPLSSGPDSLIFAFGDIEKSTEESGLVNLTSRAWPLRGGAGKFSDGFNTTWSSLRNAVQYDYS